MRSILEVWSIFRPYRRFDNYIDILLQTAFTVHGWSHDWGLKQITFGGGPRVVRVMSILREYTLRELEISTGSTFLVLSSIPTISDVCTAGTACCTRGSVLHPALAVFGPSVLVLLILPVRAVSRTPRTRVLQYAQHQQYPEYRTP